jgi:CubicO group peptidase (beta-lactamase class C family)
MVETRVTRWLRAALVALGMTAGAARGAAQGAAELAADRVDGPVGARVDSLLARYAAYGFEGAVLVAKDGRVVLVKGYGLSDHERNIPNRAGTLFEMNSITKTFTGAAILRLEADGKLRTTDSLFRFLGPLDGPKRGATIEHLATHTAGLVREADGARLDGSDRDAFLASVKRLPAESPPGERYRYTNAGFSVLAGIVEIASGESYDAYLRRHLFAPAGMTVAGFRGEFRPDDPRLAHGYIGTPGGLEPGPPNPYTWGTIGAGGVVTTVGEMYRWHLALHEGRIVPEAQRTRMFAPRPTEGYGWHVGTGAHGRQIDKGGGSPDFASQLLYFPDHGLVVIWASNNLRQRWRRTLNAGIVAAALGEPVTALPPVTAIPAAVLIARAGRYRASSGEIVELRAGPGYLFAADSTLGVPAHLMFFPQSASEFTGFDPVRGTLVPLRFLGGDLELASGLRLRRD